MPILTIQNLHKRYGRIQAVDDLSLQINSGQVYGLLGPNGSGKTTTLGMLLGIISPNSGSFEWFDGKYGTGHRRHIGSLLETPNFYPFLNAIENLKIIAHIRKVYQPDIEGVLELVNLKQRMYSRFKTYSLGMKQRLAIAAAMIGDPQVLILDEPTNGLDPQGIAEVRTIVQKIAQSGKTILMASHILDEVERICSHVAILKNGQLLASGSVGTLLTDDQIIELAADDNVLLGRLLERQAFVQKIVPEDGLLLVHCDKNLQTSQINKLAFDENLILTHLAVRAHRLEAEFLQITADKTS